MSVSERHTDDHGNASQAEHGHSHGSTNWELIFAITSGVTYFAGLAAEHLFNAPTGVYLSLFLATYFFGGFFTVKEAAGSISRGKFEVDFLMIVAAIGAAAVGKFSEGAVLLFLFSLGHALEEYAMSRATKSIDALAELAPRTAQKRLPTGDLVEVSIEDVRVGDTLAILPDTRIPADGYVLTGTSSVDQAAVTGESIPVEKFPLPADIAGEGEASTVPESSRLFAGTVNGSGAMDMRVTAAAQDTTLARVVKLVREADASQAPSQRAVDRFQKWYVPGVIVTVLAVWGFGVAFVDEPFAASFYRAMLVLVAASPCALAIATPAAVLSAIARAGRAGILVKGGAPLELLGRVDAMAFDKTGTLTWGQPSVTDVVTVEGATKQELSAVAVAVEQLSDHPLASAIARDLAGEAGTALREATGMRSVPGRGVEAKVGGEVALVGNVLMMEEGGIPLPAQVIAQVERLQGEGRTTMVVALGARVLGVIGVMDVIKAEGPQTLAALKQLGVRQLVMISGDNQRVADSIGRQVGVDQVFGAQLPEGKVQTIEQLNAQGYTTAMIGDGVNDSPALAVADVGIAMGAAGSAVALEAADVALMSDDLGRLPFGMRLSRATSRIIKQNLFAAMGIVAILVPASLLGLAMAPIVVIHEGSTLLVIANALRLLNFQRGRDHEGIIHEDSPEEQADN